MATRPGSRTKLQILANILHLEARKGYVNEVVTGGLDKFLELAFDELTPILSDLPSYAGMTRAERREWAEGVMRRIAKNAPKDGPSRRAASQTAGQTATAVDASPQPRRAASARPRRPRPPLPPVKVTLPDSVSLLRSVNKSHLPKLEKLGISTVEDLLYQFPLRHLDYANIRKVNELVPGEEQTTVVTVWEARLTGRDPRRKATQAVLGDDTGNLHATWFNSPWLAKSLSPGTKLALSGRVGVFGGRPRFENPDYDILDGSDDLVHAGRLVPVYPLTRGLYLRTARRMAKEVLDAALDKVEETLPAAMLERLGLVGVRDAISQMHFPDSTQHFANARSRLAFDELFVMQLAVLSRRLRWREADGIPLAADSARLSAFLESLPFRLTGAQARALDEILADLRDSRPMSRLLQGDVGSGKTVVAAATLLAAVLDGYQGALMAPTEILAEQHYLSVTRMLSGGAEAPTLDENVVRLAIPSLGCPAVVALLLGSMRKRVKDDLHGRIADGEVDIVIGTQALIQDSVDMPRLAVAVVDEQHRFGVMQRSSLRGKGVKPHMLAMSATPIPRSLALTVYGDLDASIIDEMPPGRQPVRTVLVAPERRAAAYEELRREVLQGRQAFVVCPLVEESEAIQSRAAIEEHRRLSSDVFPDLRVGLLHGRMPLREKELVLEEFQRGEYDVLVTTPVVEVGIDVPNATVMLIDGADRFGLAQLHQFRGRVGRGEHRGQCLLLADAPGQDARERLKLMERIQDGFVLAEEDLRLRGSGDYLGTRQSGLPDLRVARPSDQSLLALARREAQRLLDEDPDLEREEHALLARRFRKLTASAPFDAS